MWFADKILRFRIPIIIALAGITIFLFNKAQKVQWSFDMIKIVPKGHIIDEEFSKFKAMFGEDANVMAVGVSDSSLTRIDNFKAFYELGNSIANLKGINSVISLAHLLVISVNDSLKAFEFKSLFERFPSTQRELDSLLLIAKSNKVYSGNLYNQNSAVMLISIGEKELNSIDRQIVIAQIENFVREFEQKTGIEAHYAGMPYFRTYLYSQVRKEMGYFLLASLAITAVILWFFFRSFTAVLVPLILVGIVIIWTLGTLTLFGYKITILTGLLPPILVVIGIPNCVYLINKFHQEFRATGSKTDAVKHVIYRIGFVTLITNLTTAIGFAVLVFTGIKPMVEFGIIASINIIAAFVVSITFLPIVFSYLPSPKQRHIQHLNFVFLNRVIIYFAYLVENRRREVFGVVGCVVILSIWGSFQTKSVAYMLDDVPKSHSLKQDLQFFERNFGGIMPLELVINTGSAKGYLKRGVLERIDSLQTVLSASPLLTEPVSLVSLLKACNQAYFGTPEAYQLPTQRERPFILKYLKNSRTENSKIVQSFLDTSGQFIRVSLKIADIGSVRLDSLVENFILPAVKSVGLETTITGTTLMFVKGNDFLIKNLIQSILLAFVLNAVIMGFMFGNFRMVIISLIANIIPMILTYGLMGFFDIALKPSTAIVFSIAFGIAVDDAIHFLARYKLEMSVHRGNVIRAIEVSLRETGFSMIYTSTILFFGFIIFTFSSFGGTVSLGLLTSVTLITAMITNLILLPCMLRAFGAQKERMRYFVEEAKKYTSS